MNQATTVNLFKQAGTGTPGSGILGGATSATMLQGTNTVTINGVNYSTAETGVVLRADDDTIPNEAAASETGLLPGNSQSFDVVLPPATQVRIDPTVKRIPVNGSTQVSLVADLPQGSTLGAWTIDVTFDPSLVDATNCTTNVLGASSACNVNYASDKVRVTGANPSGLSGGSITLATITFQALPSVPSGSSSTVLPTLVTFADPVGASLPAGTTPGSLVIGSRCDVDLDGDIDAVDALKILRMVAGLEAGFADADGDGDMDAVDALRILRYVAGFLPSC